MIQFSIFHKGKQTPPCVLLTYCKVENEKCIYDNKIVTLSATCQLSSEPNDLVKGEDVQNDDPKCWHFQTYACLLMSHLIRKKLLD